MSVEHKNLTGASLHEPKGVAAAGADTAYIADGAGSGAWTDPLAGVNNKNLLFLAVPFADVSAPSSIYVPVPLACKLTKVTVVTAAVTTGTNVFTAQIVPSGSATGAAISDINISHTGVNVNQVSSDTASSSNSLAVTDTVRIISDGGGTVASAATVVLTLDVS